MGQKSSPIALRLQTNKDFTSSWYSDKLYSNILHTQLMVDKFLPKVFTQVQTNATKTHTMYCPGVLNIYTFFTSPRQFDDKVQKKTVQLKPSNFFKQPSSFHWKFISNQLSYESFGSKLLFQLCLQKKNFTKTQNVSTTFQALRPNSTTNFNLKFYSNHLEGVFQDYCETTVYWKPLKVDKLSKSASFIAAFVAHGLENQKPVKQLFSFVQTLLKKIKTLKVLKSLVQAVYKVLKWPK